MAPRRERVRALLVAFALFTALYFARPSWTTKVGAIWLLATHLVVEKASPVAISGLLFSSLGDYFLELDVPGEASAPVSNFFVFGLVSFLIAHVLYSAAFWTGELHPSTVKIALPGFGTLYAALMYLLIPRIESALVAPVAAYGLVISGMGLMAVNRSLTRPSIRSSLAVGGALVFLLSDALLAFDKFHVVSFDAIAPVSAKQCVMLTYYLAQLAIALSRVWPCKPKEKGK